jgi:hypothetical protein
MHTVCISSPSGLLALLWVNPYPDRIFVLLFPSQARDG